MYLEDIKSESLMKGFEFFEKNKNYRNLNKEAALHQASKFDWGLYAKEYVSYVIRLMCLK